MNALAGQTADRERLVRMLSAVTFLIFFQAYMVAPIIPALSATFAVSAQTAGLVVPAYLLPYGFATLVYGVVADRLGIRAVIFLSLAAFAALTGLTATARSVEALIAWRLLTGVGASGVVPLALILVGALYPYEQRGRPLGWLFGAMAGGMAFGSTVGAVLESFVGWRGIFLGVGGAGVLMWLLLWPYGSQMGALNRPMPMSLRDLARGYRELLAIPRARRTYGYVLLNSIFHSGVFTWLGVYFERRYGLGSVGIGLALLGYGVPGFLFGPLIGRAADRWGRGRLLPIGLGIGAVAAFLLIMEMPLVVAAVATTILSLGYDMTQPLFAGIVTALSRTRPGQAMGLNVFMLFVGFGLGSLMFGEALRSGFGVALLLFAVGQSAITLGSIVLFRSEKPANAPVTADMQTGRAHRG